MRQNEVFKKIYSGEMSELEFYDWIEDLIDTTFLSARQQSDLELTTLNQWANNPEESEDLWSEGYEAARSYVKMQLVGK